MRRVILGAVNPNPSDPFGSQRNDFLAFNGNTEIFVRAFELAEYNQALYDLIESYYHSNSMEECKLIFNEIEKEVSFHNGGTYNLRTKKISPKNLDETLPTMGDITSDKDIEDAFRMKASLEARPHEAHFEALFGSKSPRNQRILFDMAKTMEPGKLLLGALYSYRTNGNHDRLDLIERILVEMGSKADKYLWMLSDIEQDLSKEMIDDVIKRLEVEQAPKSKGERMDGKLGQIAKKTIEPITSHPKSSTGANSYCLFCKQFYPTSKPIADFKCVHCSPTEKESSALPKPATHPENCFTCGKKTNFYGYSFNEHPSNYMCEECKGFSREDPEFVLEQFHYRDFPYRPGHIWYNGKQFHNGKSWFLECEKCGILDPKPMKWFERVMVSFGRGFNREQPPFAPFTPKPGQIWNGYASCFEVKELRVAKQAEEDRLVLEKERKESLGEGMTGVIETDRLILRPLCIDDAEDTFAIDHSPGVLDYTGDEPSQDVAEELPWLQDTTRLAVIEKSTSRLIGWCGLVGNELGYRFHRDAWGCGYCTEACRAIVERQDIPIVANVDPLNTRSLRVLEKLGFVEMKEHGWYILAPVKGEDGSDKREPPSKP